MVLKMNLSGNILIKSLGRIIRLVQGALLGGDYFNKLQKFGAKIVKTFYLGFNDPVGFWGWAALRVYLLNFLNYVFVDNSLILGNVVDLLVNLIVIFIIFYYKICFLNGKNYFVKCLMLEMSRGFNLLLTIRLELFFQHLFILKQKYLYHKTCNLGEFRLIYWRK